MSKNDVAGDRGPNGGSDDEGDASTERVDLGIGISVELELEDDPEDESLAFDEADLLEAATVPGPGPSEDDVAGAEPVVDADGSRNELTDDERDALEAADVDPDGVRAKEYSYRMLLDAGVDEPTADALRRRFSLPWSFAGDDGDLERRSSEIRGLGEIEREWIAASDDESWQAFEYDRSPIERLERDRPDERPYPRPTSPTAVTGVGPDDADRLAEAGVRSAEQLARIDAFAVARALDLDVVHVRTWRHNARELLE